MTTHVFIVDWRTFKLHLEYLFAGTGAKETEIDFNNSGESMLHSTTERNSVGMLADASRVRPGDQIIFYLQQDAAEEIYEGKFFGVFKAADESFLDPSGEFLSSELGKRLTFRTRIVPFDVYPKGVTEWEALDEIKAIKSPCQMLWSLIYRKLKGNRGNTMITMYESERLLSLIRNKNQRRALNDTAALSFDKAGENIVGFDGSPSKYTGRKENIDIFPRLQTKNVRGNKFEVHLQSYVMQHLGNHANPNLDAAVLEQGQIEWLGNEVSCGVGMQRIDVVVSVKHSSHRSVLPIELKCDAAQEFNLQQIQRYVDWIRQYYIPNQPSDIRPILLARQIENKTASAYQNLIAGFGHFNRQNKSDCAPLRYIEFTVGGVRVEFQQILY